MVIGVSRYPDESCPRIASESDFEGCTLGVVHEQARNKKVFTENENGSKIDFTFLIYLSNSDVKNPQVIWVALSWLFCMEEWHSCHFCKIVFHCFFQF